MKKTSVARGVATPIFTYAVFACINSSCEDGEFSAPMPPIYVEMPSCPCCGCPSLLMEVLGSVG